MKIIEIQETVKIVQKDYNLILEKGDKIRIAEDSSFDYQMLGRLQSDCEYAIKTARSIAHLWGITIESHIAEMRKIYQKLRVKPEWLSLEDIDYYERELKKLSR